MSLPKLLIVYGGLLRAKDWTLEWQVELLTRLHSPYLLTLIGHCSDHGGHRLLVYEFMANGGLQEHLYPAKGMFISPFLVHRFI